MIEILHKNKYDNEIPLSNNTVTDMISEINNDPFQQLITRHKESPKFAIQLDKTTDISKLTQLLVYIRYICKENIDNEL